MLELGERCQEVEPNSPWGKVVSAHGSVYDRADPPAPEILQSASRVHDAAEGAIQFPDEHEIDLSTGRLGQQLAPKPSVPAGRSPKHNPYTRRQMSTPAR